MVQPQKEFEEAMWDIYHRADKEVGFKSPALSNMIYRHGGVETARRLINAPKGVSDGYKTLSDKKRMDLTVEAVVLTNSKWHPLFSEGELKTCKRRLKQYEYEI